MYRSHFRLPFTFLAMAVLLVTGVLTYNQYLFVSASSGCALPPGQPYAGAGHATIYYVTDDCTRQIFPDTEVYFSHFDSLDRIKVFPEIVLASIPRAIPAFVPWGLQREFADGQLLKSPESPRVYVVKYHTLYPIASDAVLTEVFPQASTIFDVTPEVIASFPKGHMIRAASDDPSLF